eukprot:511440-Hanusia_phi.AAC.2
MVRMRQGGVGTTNQVHTCLSNSLPSPWNNPALKQPTYLSSSLGKQKRAEDAYFDPLGQV